MSIRRCITAALLLAATPLHAALNIFACEPEWGALAAIVAGPDAAVTVATGPHQDPHHVEARPALLGAVRRADLVACTGAGLEEAWLPVLLARGGNPAIQRAPGLFLAADHVTLIEPPDDTSRAAGHVHREGNPHLHLDPRLLPQLAEGLARQLGTLRPAEADAFVARATRFATRWQAHLAAWERRADALAGQPVVVHHRSWSYLARWLGLDIIGELEPRPGIPPAPAHLAALRETVAGRTPLILRTPFDDARPSRWLAGRGGGCPLELPFTTGSADEAGLVALFEDILTALEQGGRTCRE